MSRKEYQKLWRENNRDKCASYSKKYNDNHKEKRRQMHSDWVNRNRDWSSFQRYLYRMKNKKEAIKHYSNGTMSCTWCGQNDIDVLCIDHINDNGAEDRRELKISSRGVQNGLQIYDVLKRRGYPLGYQILCANCNLKKEILRKRNEKIKTNKYFMEHFKEGEHKQDANNSDTI